MLARFRNLCLTLAAVGGMAGSASGFSMMGPFAEWQVPEIGYNPPGNVDMGGPMNLGEKYRWNIRTVFYAYDSSFLQYFGVQGTAAVERAVAVLNALPPVSQMSSNLAEFPLSVRRVNYQASALNLVDLKTYTLGHLLTHLGLAAPERYTWTLRARVEIAGPPPYTNYTVIRRNFDPVTLNPSSFVNGVLYTYVILDPVAPVAGFADAVEIQVDPLATDATSVVGMMDDWNAARSIGFGEFVTGLTRDDVGGLRHLYGRSNPLEHWHIEALPAATTAATSSSPWGFPGAPVNTNFVNQALRPGVDKVTFQRVNYDSLLGLFVAFTNQWTDTFISNGVFRTQNIQRVVTEPDIVFTSEDLGVDADGVPAFFSRTSTEGWANNDTINGASVLDGPGVISGPIQYAFSRVGPYFMNQFPFFMDEAAGVAGAVWGSFDGTTNPPVVFPSGSSIQELKQQVIHAAGEPWTIANSLGIVTNGAAAGGVIGAGN